MKSHFEKNRTRYKEAISSATDWYVEVLCQEIDLDAIKENRLKIACHSKKTAYDGIVAIWNRNEFNEESQAKVVGALDTAWSEMLKVVETDFVLANSYDEGIESDVAKSVGEAKKFAEDMLHEISNAIDSIEANDEVLEQKTLASHNKLHRLRIGDTV